MYLLIQLIEPYFWISFQNAEIAGLDGPCVASEPAPDQCAVENAECKTNGTAKCQCKVTHYVNVAACTISKARHIN